MAYTLEQLATEIRQALKAQPGPEGRQKVCAIVQNVLKDSAFVTKHVGDDVPDRKILFEDPELGFCILAHNYKGAKESNPHDHAHSWAIYGQAMGETEMTDWDLVETSLARPVVVASTRSSRAWRTSTTRATCTHRGARARPSSFASKARTWTR